MSDGSRLPPLRGVILDLAMAKVRVQEVRKLLLPIDTVVDAVLELDRSHGGALALGKLMEARVETGTEPGLTLVVMQGSGSAAAAVQKHYTLPAVAAAVIHYCFRARIPLPRQATKSIEIVGEGFQLTIHHTTEVLRLHSEVPQVSQVEVGAKPSVEPVVATGDAALDDPTNAPPVETEAAATAAA
jgi:signal-transduction protein with cAMP-binding, CBS, and nucleotidyltransferase domain